MTLKIFSTLPPAEVAFASRRNASDSAQTCGLRCEDSQARG